MQVSGSIVSMLEDGPLSYSMLMVRLLCFLGYLIYIALPLLFRKITKIKICSCGHLSLLVPTCLTSMPYFLYLFSLVVHSTSASVHWCSSYPIRILCNHSRLPSRCHPTLYCIAENLLKNLCTDTYVSSRTPNGCSSTTLYYRSCFLLLSLLVFVSCFFLVYLCWLCIFTIHDL